MILISNLLRPIHEVPETVSKFDRRMLGGLEAAGTWAFSGDLKDVGCRFRPDPTSGRIQKPKTLIVVVGGGVLVAAAAAVVAVAVEE